MSTGRTTRRTRVIFGSGTGAIATFNTLRQLFFAVYAADVVGVDPRVASLVAVLGLAADVWVVPRIGAWSDATRSPLGRRIPFLRYGAVPAGLSFLLLWWAPPWADATARAVHLVLAWLTAHALQSVVIVPYLALVPEISRDYDDRTALTSWRMVFSILASLGVAMAAPVVLDAAAGAGASRAASHLVVAGLFGVIATIPWLGVGFGIQEPAGDHAAQPPMGAALREAWRNRPFRTVALLYLATWTAFELVALMMPFYLTYHVSSGDRLARVALFGAAVPVETAVLGTLLISAIPAVPVWAWLSGRLGKRTAFAIGIGAWAVAEVLLVLVPAGRPGLVVALAAFSGIGVATAHVLPDAMLPDTIDWGELQSGHRSEGVYVAVWDLVRRVAGALALFVALQVLGWAGYQAPPEGVTHFTQPDAASSAILALTGPVGLGLLCIALLAAWRFPLGRDDLARIQADIRARR